MRLLIVSNRLPVTLKRNDGEFLFEKSAGGLVSGLGDYLASLKDSSSKINEYLWLGWPGIPVKKQFREPVREKVQNDFNASPVFLPQSLMNSFYLGFCNKTIWPLFHYFPNYAVFNREHWDVYKRVNSIFRDELLAIIKPGDIIWVHDYHLMLLPRLLREKVSNPIGFFLHIPFPAYEMFRMLPDENRKGLLSGLLGADLIGFHTHDYSQYFLRCVLRILGIENHMGRIDFPDRTVRVDTFPMGVDYNKFNKLVTQNPHPGLPEKDCKIILSVDRQDYSKGILKRLQGFALFLQKYPQWHGKVCLSMIVVPSRIGLDSYREIKSSLDELVGFINGEYGTFKWTPVIYQYTSLPHETLISLFRTCEVALLTPLRDGMNLVAKEYVASRNDKKGVLILSEFTGASKELTESIIINPNNIEEISDAIHEALNMPLEEQICRNEAMQERLERYDVNKWASGFVDLLVEMKSTSEYSLKKKYLNGELTARLLNDYRKASKKLLIFNYDGTIVPLDGKSRSSQPSEDILVLLREIKERSGSDIAVLSGRTREELDMWLGDVPADLAAEHGSWIKRHGSPRWTRTKPLSGRWKEDILPVLETYTDRLPGARIKEKDYSVSWDFNKSDIEQASYISRELMDHLVSITANTDIQIFRWNKSLEISNSGVNKGDLTRHWLNGGKYDFIFAIGAGWSDELIFQALPENAYSVKVDLSATDAAYIINGQDEVIKLLKKLK